MRSPQILAVLQRVALGVGLAAFALLTACQSDHRSAPVATIASPTSCDTLSISIYFDRRSARLDSGAIALLSAAAQQAHRCRVDSIDVIGLADAPGTPQANAAISEARAKSVTRALTVRGFPAFSFKPAQTGPDGGAPTSDPGSFRRRADVIFRLSPAR